MVRGAELRAGLLRWYDGQARDLPWRRTRDPYAIWVSEVMLQQTQVSVVLPYWSAFLARFPDVHDGYDRLGMVCEARGDHRQAAEYYRKAIAVIRDHPDDYDPEFEAVFRKLVDRLDPPGADTPA